MGNFSGPIFLRGTMDHQVTIHQQLHAMPQIVSPAIVTSKLMLSSWRCEPR
jgi:hypothetical protein